MKTSLRDPFVERFSEELTRKNLLPEEARVAVAVSGGLGSTALAAALTALKTPRKLQIRLFHTEESPATTHDLRTLAAALELELEVLPLPSEQGTIPLVSAIAAQAPGWTIATGETEETGNALELLEVLHGDTLARQNSRLQNDFQHIRPLLFATEDACRAFLERQRISFPPETNPLSLETPQKRVRLLLFPLLRNHIQPAFSQGLSVFRERTEEDEAFLTSLTSIAEEEVQWQSGDAQIVMHIARFRLLPAALRRRLLDRAVATLLPQHVLSGRDLNALEQHVQDLTDANPKTDVPPLSLEKAGDTLLIRCL